MTAQPHLPATLLTVAQYAALGEDDDRLQLRSELQEGSIVMSPSPRLRHNQSAGELYWQLRHEQSSDFEIVQDIDVDVELVPPDQPGTVRRPDLVVITRDAAERLAVSDEMIKASDVVLVVEIISPSSKRMDNVIKHSEYADAGIPYYWIVDLNPPVSIVSCHRAGEFGYQDSGAVTGEFHATEPFDVRIDLTKLG